MYIANEFTRYSAAANLTNKAAAGKKFMKHWIAVFGPPKKVFSDHDGEFIGDSFVEMCEQFNINLKLQHQKVHGSLDSVRDIIKH